jgi:hypothetical protein
MTAVGDHWPDHDAAVIRRRRVRVLLVRFARLLTGAAYLERPAIGMGGVSLHGTGTGLDDHGLVYGP